MRSIHHPGLYWGHSKAVSLPKLMLLSYLSSSRTTSLIPGWHTWELRIVTAPILKYPPSVGRCPTPILTHIFTSYLKHHQELKLTLLPSPFIIHGPNPACCLVLWLVLLDYSSVHFFTDCLLLLSHEKGRAEWLWEKPSGLQSLKCLLEASLRKIFWPLA